MGQAYGVSRSERLVDRLDVIERRIKIERAKIGALKGAVVAFAFMVNPTPLAEYLASRRRLKALEHERDQLLGIDEPLGHDSRYSDGRA